MILKQTLDEYKGSNLNKYNSIMSRNDLVNSKKNSILQIYDEENEGR